MSQISQRMLEGVQCSVHRRDQLRGEYEVGYQQEGLARPEC